MTQYYPALIRKDSDSDFGVEFPDLPGCVTSGTTIDETLRLAEEALRFHVDGMLEDSEPVPPPAPIESVLESGAAQGAAIYLVRLQPEKGRSIRLNITLDEHLLEKIDIAAVQLGMSRSGFLSDAARTALVRRFDERLESVMNETGRPLDKIGHLIAEDNKAAARLRHPPDTSKIGRTNRDS
ncbi:MAG: type II toxin-antitoxin system HicB family antitoxin [Proteobacteria bacterium]|nr:type II toxin-antitoxin system HicB family antitoxin [Pseudomonadota bacterium]MDA1326058.1 type II toxin-antitoxin system HicB family antitoxin [Pseudomonadota bacterium]